MSKIFRLSILGRFFLSIFLFPASFCGVSPDFSIAGHIFIRSGEIFRKLAAFSESGHGRFVLFCSRHRIYLLISERFSEAYPRFSQLDKNISESGQIFAFGAEILYVQSDLFLFNISGEIFKRLATLI